ncbi:MAG: hypothetical protein QOD84_2041 [Acidobacteriaceae bacterium]
MHEFRNLRRVGRQSGREVVPLLMARAQWGNQ